MRSMMRMNKAREEYISFWPASGSGHPACQLGVFKLYHRDAGVFFYHLRGRFPLLRALRVKASVLVLHSH